MLAQFFPELARSPVRDPDAYRTAATGDPMRRYS